MKSEIREDLAILQELQGFVPERLFVQRDDLLHPIISGNKWRKLKGWIAGYRLQQASTLVTFGGAYSNHLVATAAAGNLLGIPTVGILRGEEGFDNHYLQLCRKYGMQLIPVSRELYKDKVKVASLVAPINSLVVPEGGSGNPGFIGFEELVNKWTLVPDVIYLASATATTAVGLALQCKAKGWPTKIKAIMVLKNREEQELFAQDQGVLDRIDFISDYDFGGYAKCNNLLLDFINSMFQKTNIKLDPIYTGKAFYGMLREEEKSPSGVVFFLHTGGELGRLSAKYKDVLFS